MRRLAVLMIAGAVGLMASSTAVWEMNTFADFSKGRFAGLSLSRDGRMALAPRVQPLFSSEQPAIWSVAEGKDGVLYAGTGHRGRVFRVAPDGKSTLIWTAAEPEVFAVAAGPDGAVYAGTSPNGKIYRIENGRASEYFNPHTPYIWALTFGPDGALYAATGDSGRIFRVTKAGTGELWYDTGQQHITALAFDTEGRLLAGSEPNGILYRIRGKNDAFVIYDATLPEIRTIAVSPNGAVYAAALGGSVASKASAAASAIGTSGTTLTAPSTTITVTEEGTAAQTGLDIRPKAAEVARAVAPIAPGTTVYSATSAETAGVDKSALYRINPDNTVEVLWSSKEENLYDLLLAANDEVIFSTDVQGRIYRMTPDRQLTLLAQTGESEITRLVSSGESLVAATGSSGQLLRIGSGFAPAGSFESPVHDAGSVAHWGQLSWRGKKSAAGNLVFRTRAGNSVRPDRTWSPWSDPMSLPDGAAVTSPAARYVQWRAEFSSPGESPSLTAVTLSYLPQNNPPVVRSINVLTQIVPAGSATKVAAPQPSASSTYSITVTDTPDAGASTLSGTPTQTVSRGLSQQIQLTWQADDADGDRLSYTVFYRGEEESDWKTLRAGMFENILTLEGDVLADGKYLFRVVATDRLSNSGAAARHSELVSPPVLFDNTPPVITASGRRESGGLVLEANAADTSSSLRRAEYSLDATSWSPLDSADGIVDGRSEKFTLRLDRLSPAEHVVVVRVFDASGNSGLAKVVIPATP